MKTRLHALRAALCLLVAAAGAAHALDITDDRGRKVHFDRPPQRIVTLLPSLTESVCGLNECQRLVGVDRYSNYPESVRQLPQVGGGIDPNVEAIVALRPEVVMLATSSRASERLEALGIKVVALEPKTHASVQRVLRQVATVLGAPPSEADRLWRVIDAGVEAAAQSLPPQARRARVYFEVSRGPYAAG